MKFDAAAWSCLLVMNSLACSSATAPPAEGRAAITFCSLPQQNIPGTGTDTALNGTNGIDVSCNVAPINGGFRLSAHIGNEDWSLTANSSLITPDSSSNKASMTFYANIKGSYYSVNDDNRSAATCSLSIDAVQAGSIRVSNYDCPNIVDPQNLQSSCTAHGSFLFTGCGQ